MPPCNETKSTHRQPNPPLLPNSAFLFAEVHSAKLDADKKPITGSDGFFVADQLLVRGHIFSVGSLTFAQSLIVDKNLTKMIRNDLMKFGHPPFPNKE